MTAPEVDFVLSAIENNWPGGTALADIPLERIDRDNADNLDKAGSITELDGPVHEHTSDLEEMNFVLANLVSRPQEPDGTEFNLMGDAIVDVRVEGAHVSEGGAIDPQDGTADAATHPTWPVTTWDSLTDNLRRAIYTDREFPSVSRSNASYKDLFIENWDNQAANYTNYYLLTFTVRFSGFETLP